MTAGNMHLRFAALLEPATPARLAPLPVEQPCSSRLMMRCSNAYGNLAPCM